MAQWRVNIKSEAKHENNTYVGVLYQTNSAGFVYVKQMQRYCLSITNSGAGCVSVAGYNSKQAPSLHASHIHASLIVFQKENKNST